MRVIGGANLIAVTGAFGSGKSLLLTEFGLALADNFQKPIILTFFVNKREIYKYCKYKKLNWLVKQMEDFDRGHISNDPIQYVELLAPASGSAENKSLDLLFCERGESFSPRRNCVVIADELGIFLNARNWQKVSSNFSKFLVQVRRANLHLIVAFQFLSQVDRQFRYLVQHWIVCKSYAPYNKKLKGPEMQVRFVYHYTASKFNKLDISTANKDMIVRPWLWAKQVDWHILLVNRLIAEIFNLTSAYKSLQSHVKQEKFLCDEDLLFRCYDSFEIVATISEDVKDKKKAEKGASQPNVTVESSESKHLPDTTSSQDSQDVEQKVKENDEDRPNNEKAAYDDNGYFVDSLIHAELNGSTPAPHFPAP